ncbi:MAG TPA: TetR/AcrR family transcriptional regulator [Methylibium sp.]|nr:TetR/AcrR family transcriptional regulator [Methylibium sp.]
MSPAATPLPTRRPRVRRGNAADRAALRRDLIDAALRLFSAGGLEAVTMRAVATEVGVSPMAPYRYFADKADLLSGLWDFVLRALLADLRRAVAPARSGRERLAASIDAFLGYWERHPSHYRLLYHTEAATRPAAESALTQSPVYAELLELSLGLTRSFADELGVGMEHAKLAGDMRFAMQLGYLYGTLVNRRYPWGDPATLRRTYIEQIVEAVAHCLRDGPPDG